MPAAEIKVTIHGPVTVVLNDHSSGPPAYLLRNTPKLVETPEPDQETVRRQGEHGVSTSLSGYGPRTLVFEGEIIADDQDDRKEKEETLKQALSLRALQSYAGPDGLVLVEIEDEDGALKQCYAKIVSKITFDVLDNADPSRRGFGFVMMAPDSFLYSQTLESESGGETYEGTNFQVVQGVSPTVPFQLYENTPPTVTCDVEGTEDTPPVITITGPTDSPKITNVTTGKFFWLDGLVLEDGQTVTIDMARRRAVDQDGTDVTAYRGSGSTWWVLQVGENEITLLDDTPSEIEATAQVQWRSAYL